jgi:peptidoglycan/LPS O-acetylase OafA/YrhL
VHVPVAGVLLAVFTRMRPTHQAAAYAALFLTYFFSLILAYFLHRAVELPALRLSQKLKSLYENPPGKIEVEDR